MKIDVLMGGPGREAAVSRTSGAAVVAALVERGHDVLAIDLPDRLEPARLRPGAVVFNVIHGTYGEDGTLQGELDALGKSYVGSDAAVSRRCMNKQATKDLLSAAGIRVPWGVAVDLAVPFRPSDLKLPHHAGLVLKPRDDGSSVGLKIVANPSFVLPAVEELLREVGPRPYLIEERLPGPEYTVAVVALGDPADGDPAPVALPPLRILPGGGVFDYAAKYQRDDTIEEVVPDPDLAARLAALGVAAYRAAGCRDLARTDVMATADGDLAVLEINTLPGMTGRSLTPLAARAAGIPFPVLCERLAARAWTRQEAHR
ncbi:D-alanine--D-alanine ligase [Planctomycetota bacterium]|nr:D-alanine--D-alanine ligase [Planctomycetota bacterium]